jgi:hypothetical protein
MGLFGNIVSGLKNAVATVKAAVTGQGVSLAKSTGIKPLDTIIEKAASHPFATAGIVTALVPTGVKTAITTATTKVLPKVVSAVTPVIKKVATTTAKAATNLFVGTPIRAVSTVTGIGILTTSKVAQTKAAEFVDNPLAPGQKIGEGIDYVSNIISKASDEFKELPKPVQYAAEALTAGAVAAIVYDILDKDEKTKNETVINQAVPSSQPVVINIQQPEAITPSNTSVPAVVAPAQAVAAPTGTVATTKKKKKKKKKTVKKKTKKKPKKKALKRKRTSKRRRKK